MIESTNTEHFTLSIQEAARQMENGKKVHHAYFMDWEWWMIRPGTKRLANEEGFEFSMDEFFALYDMEHFRSGWAVFEED